MAERSREELKGKKSHERPPVSMAMLGLTAGVEVGAFSERFGRALEVFGAVSRLSRETPMVRGVNAGSESRLVEWLNDRENSYRHVLYEADGEAVRWTRRCLRQADRIYLIAKATEEPKVAAERLQELLKQEPMSGTGKEFELVLVHGVETKLPEKTAAWRAAFPGVRGHHHVRMERQDDFERLARAANGRLVGVTLGGGFALGIAHVGVIRALRELKVPIDCVGGTSMGAVIAAECAMEFEFEPMLDVIVNGCASSLKGDFTLPVVSFLSGAKLGRTLGAYLERLDVEDFWLPYFSISASLRYASMRVHDRGDALRSVLASCRAPGMFPPLPWGDDLLVDGGLVNNIPGGCDAGICAGRDGVRGGCFAERRDCRRGGRWAGGFRMEAGEGEAEGEEEQERAGADADRCAGADCEVWRGEPGAGYPGTGRTATWCRRCGSSRRWTLRGGGRLRRRRMARQWRRLGPGWRAMEGCGRKGRGEKWIAAWGCAVVAEAL